MNLKTFWINYLKNPGDMLTKHVVAVNLTIITTALIMTAIVAIIWQIRNYRSKEEIYTEKTSYEVSLGLMSFITGTTFLSITIGLWVLIVAVYTVMHSLTIFFIKILDASPVWIGFKLSWTILFIILQICIETMLLHRKNYPQWLKLTLNLSIIISTVSWILLNIILFKPEMSFIVTFGGVFITLALIVISQELKPENNSSQDDQANKNKSDTNDELKGYNEYGFHE